MAIPLLHDMRAKLSHNIFIGPNSIFFAVILVFTFLLQVALCEIWAEDKIESTLTLGETIERALDFNSQKHPQSPPLPSDEIIFLVKKYYYQLQAQAEKMNSAEKVRDHFRKAVDKIEAVFEKGEGDISQFDITKLKLGLSNTLSDIISLDYALKITKLKLGLLIGKEINNDVVIITTDIVPVSFSYKNFDVYLEKKKLSPASIKIENKASVASSEVFTEISQPLDKRVKLTLYKAFFSAKEANAKVILGNKNRKITRALLVAEVANYDFGIGDSQDLFEALIIYTRVLGGYVDSVYTLNVAVAELEKLTSTIYK